MYQPEDEDEVEDEDEDEDEDEEDDGTRTSQASKEPAAGSFLQPISFRHITCDLKVASNSSLWSERMHLLK